MACNALRFVIPDAINAAAAPQCMGRWLFACLVCQLIIPWQWTSAAVESNAPHPGLPQSGSGPVESKVLHLYLPVMPAACCFIHAVGMDIIT